MSLPKLDSAIFTLNLPSNNKKITYRPFTVKHEKSLLIAKESEDFEQILTCMKEVLNDCTVSPENLDIGKLPVFDVEYFFLNLRSKSVGEKLDLFVSHSHAVSEPCDHQQKISLDLDDVKVFIDDSHTKNIMITDNIGITMKYLGIEDIYTLQEVQKQNVKSDTDMILNVLADSIDYIFEGKKVYNMSEISKSELIEWLENLSESQILKLQNFFKTYPKLRHEINYTCSKCGQKDKIVLEGISNFFG